MCNGWEDFYLLDYNEVQPEMIMKLYFEKCLKWLSGANLTYWVTGCLCVILWANQVYIDMSNYLPIIRNVLPIQASGIEINSSGLRRKWSWHHSPNAM